MSTKEVKKFIMFYERITRDMIKTLGSHAKVIINIDKEHRLKSMKFN